MAYRQKDPFLVTLLTFTDFPLQVDSQNSRSEPSLYLFMSLIQPANSSLKTPDPVIAFLMQVYKCLDGDVICYELFLYRFFNLWIIFLFFFLKGLRRNRTPLSFI